MHQSQHDSRVHLPGRKPYQMISSLGFRSKDENHKQVPHRDEPGCAHQISGAETPAFRPGEEAPSPLLCDTEAITRSNREQRA